MWLKLLLLTLYLIFLFVLCRILEAASWYNDTGTLFTSMAVLDPITLSVKKLKELLDNRGVSYSGVVEKHELVELVKTSGMASKEELIEATFPPQVSSESTHFTCGSHFYEEVEDTKDSAWLVQVIVDDTSPPLLTEQTWKEVKYKMGTFGVRSGVFKCSLDRRLCQRKKWLTSQLILALPRGSKAKDFVILHSHLLPSTSANILQFVRKHLASRVREINSEKELKLWMSYSNNSKHSEVRVILFSVLKSCPMFLSALAIKFNGRVKFATVDLTSNKSFKKYISSDDIPSYIVITPEKTFSYGARRGECYNLKSMELYLKNFVPEMNDVFLWSLLLINILAAFELFYMHGCFWKQFILYVLCVVKYNCILFMVWLLILALHQFPVAISATEIALKVVRIASGSNIAATFRNDYKSFYSNTFFFTTFGLFASVCGYLMKKFKWLQPTNEDIIFNSFGPLSTSTRLSLREMDMEVDMELFIERLAVPNFWLQPVISMDYVKNLPMWKYQGWCEADDELEERKGDVFSSDDEAVNKPLLTNTKENFIPKFESVTVGINSAVSATFISCEEETYKYLQTNFNSVPPAVPSVSGLNVSKTNKVASQKSDTGRAPRGMLEFRECSICLENYRYGECLCGLPCGHNYHMNCIMVWLSGDNHCCPICRWPSYKFKLQAPHLHSQ